MVQFFFILHHLILLNLRALPLQFQLLFLYSLHFGGIVNQALLIDLLPLRVPRSIDAVFILVVTRQLGNALTQCDIPVVGAPLNAVLDACEDVGNVIKLAGVPPETQAQFVAIVLIHALRSQVLDAPISIRAVRVDAILHAIVVAAVESMLLCLRAKLPYAGILK